MTIKRHTRELIAAILILSATLSTPAEADAQAIQELKEIAKRVEAFFSTQPLLYDLQPSSYSSTGIVLFVGRYTTAGQSYDVRRTDSLITPLVGVIAFDAAHESASKCGTYRRGFTAIANGQLSASKEECWEPAVPSCKVRMNYGYTESKWQFRGLESDPTGCARIMRYAAGAEEPGRQATNLNDPWRVLSTGFVSAKQ